MLTLANGAFRDDVVQRFSALGYNVQHALLNAKDFGVPQHRKRVFFVGLLDGEFHFPDGANIPEVTTREAISDLPPLDVEHEKTHEFDYPRPPDNDYQRYIRGASKRITQHLITMHTEQTKTIIGMIPDGGKIKDLPREYWEVRKFNKAFQRMPSNGVSATVDTGHRNYFHYEQNRSRRHGKTPACSRSKTIGCRKARRPANTNKLVTPCRHSSPKHLPER